MWIGGLGDDGVLLGNWGIGGWSSSNLQSPNSPRTGGLGDVPRPIPNSPSTGGGLGWGWSSSNPPIPQFYLDRGIGGLGDWGIGG